MGSTGAEGRRAGKPPRSRRLLIQRGPRVGTTLEPKCGVAALYTGLILKATEKPKEAEPFLKTAALLLPKDPRPREALESLSQKKGFFR